MKIIVSQPDHYDFMSATVIQGLQNLGHEVYSPRPGTNYVERGSAGSSQFELFVNFIKSGLPIPALPSVMCWGADDHEGLNAEFEKGYDAIFVRDHVTGEPGFPMSFGIEDRYYCVTGNGYKPLSDREIDVCFLGQLYPGRGGNNRHSFVEKLKSDFPNLNMMLGPRRFEEADEKWSRWTRPFCVHDPKYFETLANSKICLSFKGYGPDSGRTWEILASGALCMIEEYGTEMLDGAPSALWFSDYDALADGIEKVMTDISFEQDYVDRAWRWNREHHSTAARARYLLEMCGMA